MFKMKKVLFSLALALFAVAGVSAQACAKSCTSKQASATTCTKENAAAAAKLASMDQTIESRTCPKSGTVSYVRKETDAAGTVKFVDVAYDGTSNTFVNVAPSSMEGGKAACSPAGATATSGKAACGTAGSGKACCAGKAKTASAPAKTDEKGAAKGN